MIILFFRSVALINLTSISAPLELLHNIIIIPLKIMCMIKPWCMHMHLLNLGNRSVCVCVCMSVCLSVTALAATYMVYIMSKVWDFKDLDCAYIPSTYDSITNTAMTNIALLTVRY